MENKKSITGIGERVLNRDNLSKARFDVLDGIKNDIINIRLTNHNELDRPNNFISILGKRGSGKSSMILTVLKELRELYKDRNKNKCSKQVLNYDFIIDKIDPSFFNLEKNALGWIIYSFADVIEKFKMVSDSDKYCIKNRSINEAINAYKGLETSYITSREFFRDNLSALSEGKVEYEKVNVEIGKADLKLQNNFKEFISSYVKAIEGIYENDKEDERAKPLIVISFDDIDIKPQYGPDILDTVINYLCHPNIVVIMSGEYDTFKEALFIDMWNKEKIPSQFVTGETIVGESIETRIGNRVEDVLAKVMPPKYKYVLNDFETRDRLLFTPYGEAIDNIGVLFGKGDINDEENLLLKYFIEPIIDVSNIVKETEEKVVGIKDPSKRTYQGIEKEYNDLIEYNKKVKDFNDESSDDKLTKLIKDYPISRFCETLPNTPRGLINFYNMINELNEKEKLMKLKKKEGYDEGREKNLNNFNYIKKLYNIFRECNLELNHKRGNLGIEEVIKFDNERNRVIFDFKHIVIENGEDYKNGIINTSRNLMMKYKNEYIEQSESTLIELFYDMCKEYLSDGYIKINKDKDFSKILLYRRIEDNVEVYAENLRTFSDYYRMQLLYELHSPLIIKDLKVHRNIRDRLRVNMANILEYLTKQEKTNNNKYKFKVKSSKDIKKESYVQQFYTDYEKYYGEYYYDKRDEVVKTDDKNMREYNLIQFIVSYSESGYFNTNYNEFLDEDGLIELYVSLAEYILNTQGIGSRIKSISSLISEDGYEYKIGKSNKSILDNLYTYINEAEKEEEYKDKYDATKYWSLIALELYKINCLLIVKIIKNVVWDNEESDKKDQIENIRQLLEDKALGDKSKLVKKKSRSEIAKYEKVYQEMFSALYGQDAIYPPVNLPNNLERISKYIDEREKDFIERNNINQDIEYEIENKSEQVISELNFYFINNVISKYKNITTMKRFSGMINQIYENNRNIYQNNSEIANFVKYLNDKDEESAQTVLNNIVNNCIKSLLVNHDNDSIQKVIDFIIEKNMFKNNEQLFCNLTRNELERLQNINNSSQIQDLINKVLEKIESEQPKSSSGDIGQMSPVNITEDEEKNE